MLIPILALVVKSGFVPAPIVKSDLELSGWGFPHFLGLVPIVGCRQALAQVPAILHVALLFGLVMLSVTSAAPQVLGCYFDPANSVLGRVL